MRLGLSLGYWNRAGGADELALAVEADRLGYDIVWASEAYGSDAVSVLASIATLTNQIEIGSAVMQIAGRTPAMTAMSAATLDGLSEGRFSLGLGVSGPQVSAGLHGVAFDDPVGRTREYVDVVRMALAHEQVRYDGVHLTLPLPGDTTKPLTLMITPVRDRVPIYLAALGPRNLRLTGEKADGWLGMFFAPEHAESQLGALTEGRRRAGFDDLTGFDVVTTVPTAIGDDLDACADALRGFYALYLGGMGSRQRNFYRDVATRMGFGAAADRVQELYLAGDKAAAAATVPAELIDESSLIGPADRVSRRIRAYADAGVTTLNIKPFGASVEERQEVLRAAAAALRSTPQAPDDGGAGALIVRAGS